MVGEKDRGDTIEYSFDIRSILKGQFRLCANFAIFENIKNFRRTLWHT